MPGTLTEQGKEQVQRAAEQLSIEGVKLTASSSKTFTRIVSSDLKRAMDSAQIIADKLNPYSQIGSFIKYYLWILY